jgi:phospholipid/cholesterol/gamma-HCH transport system substrate-binding protein
MSRGAEIRVGTTVLLALVILIASVVWLKELSLSQSKRVWHVTFPQTGGLAASDEVQVNGIRRGQVKSMKLEGDHVLVQLELSNDITLTHDSKVVIRNVGLMGEKVIFVELKTTGQPYATSDLVPGIYEPGMGEAMASLGNTVDAVVGLSNELKAIAQSLREDGKLEKAVSNFTETSEELKQLVSENRRSAKETLDNLAAASKVARRITDNGKLEGAMDNFVSASGNLDRLSHRLDSLRVTIQDMTNKVDRGEGTLGKLVNDEKLYTDLNASVTSLRALIEDVKRNPRKYFKFSVF